jgi:hypothetical protein
MCMYVCMYKYTSTLEAAAPSMFQTLNKDSGHYYLAVVSLTADIHVASWTSVLSWLDVCWYGVCEIRGFHGCR